MNICIKHNKNQSYFLNVSCTILSLLTLLTNQIKPCTYITRNRCHFPPALLFYFCFKKGYSSFVSVFPAITYTNCNVSGDWGKKKQYVVVSTKETSSPQTSSVILRGLQQYASYPVVYDILHKVYKRSINLDILCLMFNLSARHGHRHFF